MKNYDEDTKKMVLQEAAVMDNVKHLNVLEVIKYGEGQVVKSEGKTMTVLYIALQLAQQDTLFDYIVSTGAFPEVVACHYFKQFMSGIQAIHMKGMCHRDIKCENILIDDDYHLKIADFGFAAQL